MTLLTKDKNNELNGYKKLETRNYQTKARI